MGLRAARPSGSQANIAPSRDERGIGRRANAPLRSRAWPADKSRARVAETPGKLGRPGDADPRARNDLCRRCAGEQLKRWSIEPLPVIRLGYPECLPDPTRTRAEEIEVVSTTARAHLFESICRFERAHQYPRRPVLPVTDEVEAPVDAVRSIHVGAAGRTEQRRRAGSRASEPMACGLVLIVGLDFDDAAADTGDQQGSPDQLGRDFVRRAGKEVRCKRLFASCGRPLTGHGTILADSPTSSTQGRRARRQAESSALPDAPRDEPTWASFKPRSSGPPSGSSGSPPATIRADPADEAAVCAKGGP
jgi:hypothetical protein